MTHLFSEVNTLFGVSTNLGPVQGKGTRGKVQGERYKGKGTRGKVQGESKKSGIACGHNFPLSPFLFSLPLSKMRFAVVVHANAITAAVFRQVQTPVGAS